MLRWLAASSAPNGIRTRAAALKGRCPRPLDDGGADGRDRRNRISPPGDCPSIGDRRRTGKATTASRRTERPAGGTTGQGRLLLTKDSAIDIPSVSSGTTIQAHR